MEITLLNAGKRTSREVACPVCGKTTSVPVGQARPKGDFQCWNCDSKIGWSIEDELKAE